MKRGTLFTLVCILALIMTLGSLLIGLPRGVEAEVPPTTIIEWTVQGEINNEPVAATGMLRFLENGDFGGLLVFSQLPPSFHPFASGSSLLSISCGNAAVELGGAINLLSLTRVCGV